MRHRPFEQARVSRVNRSEKLAAALVSRVMFGFVPGDMAALVASVLISRFRALFAAQPTRAQRRRERKRDQQTHQNREAHGDAERTQ